MGNTQDKSFSIDSTTDAKSSRRKMEDMEIKRRIVQAAKYRVILEEESSESEDEAFDEIWTPNVNVSANFISQLCALPENDFFCEVDKAFCLNPLNLVGLREKGIINYDHALNLILDLEPYRRRKDFQGDSRKLYGLIHARYILTPLGMEKMIRKKYDEKVQRSRDRKLAESLAKKEEELLKRKGKEDAMEEEFRAADIEAQLECQF